MPGSRHARRFQYALGKPAGLGYNTVRDGTRRREGGLRPVVTSDMQEREIAGVMVDFKSKPRIRVGIDASDFPETPDGMITLHDRAGISRATINVSPVAAWLIMRMNGSNTLSDIRTAFEQEANQLIPDGTLENMVDQLDKCLFLEGPTFERHYTALVSQYRALPSRPRLAMGLPTEAGEMAARLNDILEGAESADGDDQIVGLIAPHLDYPRGRPCYAAAYAQVARRRPPERIIIIGTNHSPRTYDPVLTGSDFETPLGRSRTDTEFLERLENRCGNMRRYELDHMAEHSVELQVIWCQHLFGAHTFDVVPILCADPTVPREAYPPVVEGAGIAEVADAIRALVDADPKDTLLIAGADLSHVGRAFGDQRALDPAYLDEVKQRDEAVLAHVNLNNAEAFVAEFACGNNPTQVCSVGCMYLLMRTLAGAQAGVVDYHQAVDQAAQTGVTCAAAVFRRS